jgi:hypothetical protein
MKVVPAVVAVCACLVAAGPGSAQGVPGGDGPAVRVWMVGGQSAVYRFAGLDGDVLSLSGPAGARTIPVSSIRAVDVRRTRSRGRQIGRDAAIFGVVAAASGALLGYTTADRDPCVSWSVCFSPAETAGIGALFVGVPGIGIGALVGGLRKPGSYWSRVPLDDLALERTPPVPPRPDPRADP